ncbi:MAG: glycosyltransferase [Deltaproteobacteria bacterium]|nr:glycosyltransferase [Deltaproteobacteria bacterium]
MGKALPLPEAQSPPPAAGGAPLSPEAAPAAGDPSFTAPAPVTAAPEVTIPRPSSFASARWAAIDRVLKLLAPLCLVALVVAAAQHGSLNVYLGLLQAQTYTAVLPALAAAYTILLLLFQAARTVLWAAYRPYPLRPGPLPSLTVVIPAYNEGAMVEHALYAVAAADYPAGLLEVICVDDGSTDDTWDYICRAQARFPHLIRPLRFPANCGKKEALYAGFREARGEVLVTVDSDSVIEPDALRQVVAPLLHDREIGAVAGNVKVLNRHASFMGKMQGVRFVNLDYLRASQSRYGAVICTPGSLSAYRREALRPILEAWRRQTFLGAPCHHSEDRALTNFILRQGYYTCYQRSAVVYTLVPETYGGVCRMYLRWERGNIRESCVMLTYLFRRYRARHRVAPRVEFCLTQLEYPCTFFFSGLLLLSAALYPPIILKFLAVMALVALLNQIYYLVLERDLEFIYGLIYSFFAFFTLQWIYPYAFFTVRDRRWLTR